MRTAMTPFPNVMCLVALLFCGLLICLENNWSVFALEVRAAKSVDNSQKTTNNYSAYILQDEQGHPVFPSSVVKVKNDLYFLGPECLWCCLGAKVQTNGEDILILRQIEGTRSGELKVAWQEANDFVYLPQRESIAVVDKSGDMFEYLLFNNSNKHWQIRRANSSKLGPPDPDYVAICEMNDGILLLDPERNQIWFQSDKFPNLQALLPGVLSWKLRSGDINITDAISIAYQNGQIYVLRKYGTLSKFGIKYSAEHNVKYGSKCSAKYGAKHSARRGVKHRLVSVNSVSFCPVGQVSFNRPSHFRPSRLYVGTDGTYIVERENNRVLKISPNSGESSAYVFPAGCDLRGLVRAGNGFWIINADRLLYRDKNNEVPVSTKVNRRFLDKRLNGLILPIAGQSLPGHPGVYPGARRLYRYGVHNGLDMFNQPGSKIQVITGTPVRAVCDGRITRIDLNYKDMNYATYNRVIRECFAAHQTSPKNADLLRGCQVWVDSGNGLITKYAHLLSANNKLRVNNAVKQGDIIGYVGVSGTGENLPGRARYPHLHFEIWLDNKYLGYGLNPAETVSLFEDIFTAKNK
jgi:murein DD-endopeptidase MepM/ murein hydrolase activator NlpD